MLSALMPKEDKFFRLLESLSHTALDSALHLKAFVEAQTNEDRHRESALISSAKDTAKKISNDVTRELCMTFITPFDREDIQDFAHTLYKIPKTIEKIKERLDLHSLSTRQGDLSRQVDLIVQEAHLMQDMVKELKSKKAGKKIIALVEQLQVLEAKGDKVLADLLVSLFRDTTEARDLILRKDVYDMLEKVIDRYRDAAAIALQITLKHS